MKLCLPETAIQGVSKKGIENCNSDLFVCLIPRVLISLNSVELQVLLDMLFAVLTCCLKDIYHKFSSASTVFPVMNPMTTGS